MAPPVCHPSFAMCHVSCLVSPPSPSTRTAVTRDQVKVRQKGTMQQMIYQCANSNLKVLADLQTWSVLFLSRLPSILTTKQLPRWQGSLPCVSDGSCCSLQQRPAVGKSSCIYHGCCREFCQRPRIAGPYPRVSPFLCPTRYYRTVVSPNWLVPRRRQEFRL